MRDRSLGLFAIVSTAQFGAICLGFLFTRSIFKDSALGQPRGLGFSWSSDLVFLIHSYGHYSLGVPCLWILSRLVVTFNNPRARFVNGSGIVLAVFFVSANALAWFFTIRQIPGCSI